MRIVVLAAEHPHLQIKNPFDLGTVLQLAGLIAVIMLVAKSLASETGSAGLYLLAAVSGIVDVDALTLSKAAGGEVILGDAARAILIAAGVNTASKAVMAATLGGSRLGSMVGALSVVSLVAMAVTFVALR